MSFHPKINQLLVCASFVALLSCKENTTRDQIKVETPPGMVWVEAKTFIRGAKDSDAFALPREKPAHQVKVDGFFIDQTEVTNKQFAEFVAQTNYITVAERAIDWEELKKTLPPDTPKPHDSLLQPGCLVFNKNLNPEQVENLGWWSWQIGTSWKHPEGPESNIIGKENYPVVHIALEDALAYCKWANRRLPTEAEWEAAAQGTNQNTIFTWGDDAAVLNQNANTWQGVFPTQNAAKDGFAFIAPVKSYPPNSIGIYDLLGNVWEITSDKFNVDYYNQIDTNTVQVNPQGATTYGKLENVIQTENVIKGGSFLCHDSYCASFRISARMGMSHDSGAAHIGFRTMATKEMLRKQK